MVNPSTVPVVLGTAGHIDHGKSTLVEALTGTHPDRWEEEKKRGITMDLGYAQVTYEDGFEVGFVDVPGHERLVRKMVAGATGMGAAVLVVACDDGVMPQTREHFEVLQMLGVKCGLIALTKADLADEDTRLFVQADVEELVAGSLWESARVLEVSAHSGEGIDALREAIRELALSAQEEVSARYAFRLPVQRSFAMEGAGTVATGVCASGTVSEGDSLMVLPGEGKSRVRRVQVHGRVTETSSPGLRTALNLPDLNPKHCRRGSVLAAPGSLCSGSLLRSTLQAVAGAPELEHGQEILLLAGTASVNGRVWLPPETAEGDSLLVDLQLEDEVALVPGESLILRRPSPARNLASGRFVCFGEHRLRKKDKRLREGLQKCALALDNPSELAAAFLELQGGALTETELAKLLGWTSTALSQELQLASSRGEVRSMPGNRWSSTGSIGALGSEVSSAVTAWLRKNPHRLRIPISELRKGLGKKKSRALDELNESDLESIGLKRLHGTEWQLLDATPPEEVSERAKVFLDALSEAGLSTPNPETLSDVLSWAPEDVPKILDHLSDTDSLVRVSGGNLYARKVVEELRNLVVSQLQAGSLDIPSLRDHFQTSRKYLMPLLEHFDSKGITQRRGPNRILRNPDAEI
ncbi:MAG: selenocysteine-specific translation elongation factor [Planctomycetota bacterium]|jgi:selenocysteine-specific elongation factor|nr:selenocysteine-specific translation elongation factor [Planctomycetota bacterium]MDP6940476.1 selenocysteine-specific translation elongation factor [Planctomycetota bacterium]